MYPGQWKSCDGVITQSDHGFKLVLSTLYFTYMDVLTVVTLKTKSESINHSFELRKNNCGDVSSLAGITEHIEKNTITTLFSSHSPTKSYFNMTKLNVHVSSIFSIRPLKLNLLLSWIQ